MARERDQVKSGANSILEPGRAQRAAETGRARRGSRRVTPQRLAGGVLIGQVRRPLFCRAVPPRSEDAAESFHQAPEASCRDAPSSHSSSAPAQTRSDYTQRSDLFCRQLRDFDNGNKNRSGCVRERGGCLTSLS